MPLPRILAFLTLIGVFSFAAADSDPKPPAASAALPPLPHTVGMTGRDVNLIEAGIAAFDRHDLVAARAAFGGALAIRSQTAIANFNLGVTEFALGEHRRGERAMRLGFRLANQHGMGASPQVAAMQAIAKKFGISLR